MFGRSRHVDAADTAPAPTITSLVRQAVILPVRAAVIAWEAPGLTYAVGRQTVDDVNRAFDQARLMAAQAAALIAAVEGLVAEVAVIAARAAAVVDLAEVVAVDAARAVQRVETQLDHTQLLLEAYAPALAEAQPVVRRAADMFQPHHVDAVTSLLDLAPEVVDLIAPALHALGQLTPELGQLAERFEAIGQIVEGIPGAGLFKRRGSDDSDDSGPGA